MDKFEYSNPTRVIFGPGEVTRVGREAARIGRTALLVSTAGKSALRGLQAKVLGHLELESVRAVRFFEITANPLMSQVRAGIEACKSGGTDFVIGLGGGSVMDAAKIIAAGALYEDDPWRMIVTRHDRIVATPPARALPTLMVPTVPATASEMNCGAVVTNDETLEKSYVFAECLYPKVALVDPELTCTLPAYQTACAAADSLSHVTEPYFNGVDDTPLQDRLHEGLMRTVLECAPKVLKDPRNVALRGHLQWSAIVAWNGWLQCGTNGLSCPMHQLGHVLSARYNLAHGATLAIIMPAWMRFIVRERVERFVQYAERVFDVPSGGRSRLAVAEEGIDRFEQFLHGIGVPTRLSEVNVTRDAIEAMTADVERISFNAGGTLTSRPPVDREGVAAVYEMAL